MLFESLNPFSEYFWRSKNKAELERDEQSIRNSQGVSQEEDMLTAASMNAYNAGYSSNSADFTSMSVAFKSVFSNKTQKVATYNEMSYFPEIQDAINTIADEAITPNELGEYVKLKILKEIPLKEEKYIRKTFDYLVSDVLKFNTRGWEMFKTWLIESELFVEKVLNDKGTRIISIKLLPATTMYPIYEGNIIRKYVQTTRKISKYTLNNTQNETTFDPEQICYINYGQYGYNNLDVRGYLEASIRTWNQLRNLEDSLLIYRLTRAIERRVWNIEVGRLPPGKTEETMKNMIARYRKNFNYNSQTGTVDSAKLFQAMTEDFWFPMKDGVGSKVETLQSAMNLGELTDVNLFMTKLHKTLMIPRSRWEDTLNNVATNTAPGEITREEVKFSRMVGRLRNRFKKLFIDFLTTQLRLSNQIDHKYTRESLFDIEYCEENVFAEQKHLLNVKSRLEVYAMLSPDIATADNPNGTWSRRYALTKILNMSEEDFQLNETMKKEELAEAKANGEEETPAPEGEMPEPDAEPTEDEETGFVPKGGKQTLSTAREEGGAEEVAPENPSKEKDSENREGKGETGIFVP